MQRLLFDTKVINLSFLEHKQVNIIPQFNLKILIKKPYIYISKNLFENYHKFLGE